MATGAARTTVLERALAAENGPRRSAPVDALKAGRRAWLRGEALDMGRLAADLGTSRATLYRWVGDKDRLLSEVLWSLASDTLILAREQATTTGPDFVADVLDWFMTAITYHPSMRTFLKRDPEYALRILTGPESIIRVRMTAAVAVLLAEQQEAGLLIPALAVDDLSYLMVRIIESFMYSDLINGADPVVSKATTAIRILLHAQPLPDSRPGKPTSRRRRRPAPRP